LRPHECLTIVGCGCAAPSISCPADQLRCREILREGPARGTCRRTSFLPTGTLRRVWAPLVALALLVPYRLRATNEHSAKPDLVSSGSSLRDTSDPSLPQPGQAYFVSPDDVLHIEIFDVPDISGDYRVSANGTLTLPLLSSPIVGAGLTLDRLSQVIAENYRTARVLGNPQVTVTVKESRVHSIAVVGAVKKPQIYPLFGRTTLLDLLSQAEGTADDAGNTAIITHGEISLWTLKRSGRCGGPDGRDACSPTMSVDLKKLLDTGDPSINVDLYPGDRVTVRRAGIVYVVGAVKRPGGFPLRSDQEEMTVLKAIALAEDLKPTADRKKAMIIRKNPQMPREREEIRINLAKVLAGRTPDVQLHANDILFVPDSAGKRALLRGADAAIQVTMGLIIWRR
jgi:polysaccharide export outer membrane protein